jgi:hypothetical protein
MKSHTKNILTSMLFVWLAILSCTMPAGNQAVQPPAQAPTNTINPVVVVDSPTATFTSTATAIPTQCNPYLTANTDVNVRAGPGTVYDVIGYVPAGGTAEIAGRNDDSTWWYVIFPAGPGGHGWMAGSVTTAACVPTTLAMIVAPPTPTSPPEPTISPTAKFMFVGPFLELVPLALGDIRLVEMFLSTGKEIILRVAVEPTGSLSGSVKYKVWIDGALAANKTETLPTGSIAYWTGQTIDGPHTVRAKLDSGSAYTESNEDNNELTLTCDSHTLGCE